jgi:hypothetical protein
MSNEFFKISVGHINLFFFEENDVGEVLEFMLCLMEGDYST